MPDQKDNKPIALLPSNEQSVAAYDDLWGYRRAYGPAPETQIRKIATPEILSHAIAGRSKEDTHPYMMFLMQGHYKNAKMMEDIMAKDDKARKYLPAIYRMKDPQGRTPLWYFARNGYPDWKEVEKLVRDGVPITNIDGEKGNLLHYIANAVEPPPESLLKLLREKPEKELLAMMEQENGKGMIPYHLLRNDAMLNWMLALDKGKGIDATISNSALGSWAYTRPVSMLLGVRSSHVRERNDTLRGEVEEAQAVAMATTMLDKRVGTWMWQTRDMDSTVEYLLSAPKELPPWEVKPRPPTDKEKDARYELMRKMHNEAYHDRYHKPPPKGTFEYDMLRRAAELEKPDWEVFRRVLKDARDKGVKVDQVGYNGEGAVSENLLHTAVMRQPQHVPQLLKLKINPDAALFAVPDMLVCGDEVGTYKTQVSMAQTLKDAGAKVTRDKAGNTPVMIAMSYHNAGLVSWFLRNDLVFDKGTKKEAAAELRKYASRLDKTSEKTMNEMIDAWEKGSVIPHHAPKPPQPSDPVLISSLVRPDEYVTLASPSSDANVAAPSGRARLSPSNTMKKS